MSTARVRDRFALRPPLFLMQVSNFQSHTIGKFDCKYKVNCLPIWSWWESSCCRMYFRNGKLLLPFFDCPSDNGSVAGNIGWEVWHSNMSTICNGTISHYPWGSLEFALHHALSDAGSKKHQCRGLNLVANAATSVALCKHFSVLPFFLHSMSLNIDMKYDPFIEILWILPIQVILNMLLDLNGRSTW